MRGCGCMQCLKCGKETEENQVFCNSCLESMEQYPVKCTAPVHLPERKSEQIPKKIPKKKWMFSVEEQIGHLKATIRRLVIAVVILSLIIVLGAGFTARVLYEIHTQRLTGKNYAVETTPSASVTSVPSVTRVP